MTDFVRIIQNNRTFTGIILELSDVYGNKTTMIMPSEILNCIK